MFVKIHTICCWVSLPNTPVEYMKTIRISTRRGICRVSLGSALDMRQADRLKQALEQALVKGRVIKVDASLVERLSTACVQILIAATAAMEKAGIAFTLLRPSEVFVESFNDLGLRPVLMQWNIEN